MREHDVTPSLERRRAAYFTRPHCQMDSFTTNEESYCNWRHSTPRHHRLVVGATIPRSPAFRLISSACAMNLLAAKPRLRHVDLTELGELRRNAFINVLSDDKWSRHCTGNRLELLRSRSFSRLNVNDHFFDTASFLLSATEIRRTGTAPRKPPALGTSEAPRSVRT